jgi:hypothetical protein
MSFYPWYEIVEEPVLMQGDLIDDFEIIEPARTKAGIIHATATRFNLVILTQSCDIIKKTTTHLALCPLINLEEAARLWPVFRHVKGKENLRKGMVVGMHLLNECREKGLERSFMIVNFKRIFEAPKDELVAFVEGKKRLRLLPPYREHLSQAFARFFMRVGLPADIPPFK